MSTAFAVLRARVRVLLYGFLVLPSAVAAGFVAFAFLITSIDALGGAHGVGGFGGDAPTARSILSTIATALITVSGLTFSITIVSLQLVSQQFSPRAMRNFLGDRVNQVVAGSFVGIFAYCLLVLRTVRQGEPSPDFVPGLSVTFAIGLGVATLALLLVFIHHMSQSIQLSTIAWSVARGTISSLDKLYPESFGSSKPEPGDELLQRWRRDGGGKVVHAARPGYVQAVAVDRLVEQGQLEHARIHVAVAPGDFASSSTVVAELWDADGETAGAVGAVIAIVNERDVGQDVGYGLQQLADIAIKALSPGVNDPTTAFTAVRYLQSILELLAGRDFPAEVRRFDEADVVAVLRRHSFDEYLGTLVEVGRHAGDDERVSGVVAEAFEAIARAAREAGAEERAGAVEGAARTLRQARGRTGTRSRARSRA